MSYDKKRLLDAYHVWLRAAICDDPDVAFPDSKVGWDYMYQLTLAGDAQAAAILSDVLLQDWRRMSQDVLQAEYLMAGILGRRVW